MDGLITTLPYNTRTQTQTPRTHAHPQPCFKAAWAEHRKLHKAAGSGGGAQGAAVDPHAKTPQDRCVALRCVAGDPKGVDSGVA